MTKKENPEKRSGSKKLIIVIVIVVGLTLPFHYVPSHLQVFPKNSLTFSHTFVSESDIDKLVEQYNNASFFEKLAIEKDPFFRKLTEKGIIHEVDKY
ncbi:MAG: hypothetical protein GXO80_11515 [Chlorobi bacterium]|nr:hypothetical protein [Chlorobiota bacterium]